MERKNIYEGIYSIIEYVLAPLKVRKYTNYLSEEIQCQIPYVDRKLISDIKDIEVAPNTKVKIIKYDGYTNNSLCIDFLIENGQQIAVLVVANTETIEQFTDEDLFNYFYTILDSISRFIYKKIIVVDYSQRYINIFKYIPCMYTILLCSKLGLEYHQLKKKIKGNKVLESNFRSMDKHIINILEHIDLDEEPIYNINYLFGQYNILDLIK